MPPSPYSSGGNDTRPDGARALPRYSALSLATLPLYPTPGELDVSTIGDRRSSEEHAFDFSLETKTSSKREAWATLRLLSVVPPSLQRPRYTGGDNVQGSVILNLKKPQGIQSISVTLRGRMVTGSISEASHLFLEVVHPIWDSSSGLPPRLAAEAADSTQTQTPPPSPTTGKSTSSRLQGHYEWPFSFPFPTEFRDSIQMTSKQNKRISQLPGGHGSNIPAYTTPQTVSQRNLNFNVTYEVILKISTSGIFNAKHRLEAPLLYVPIIKPPPLPPLRSSAYLQGTYIVGPEDDPSGWHALKPMYFRLQANGGVSTATTIECNTYIANPTIYTRGTVIPCYLICRTAPTSTSSPTDPDPDSTDHATLLLHAFTAQQCLALTLYQRAHYMQDPHQMLATKMSENIKAGHGANRDERSIHLEESGTAVWWTPSESLTVNGGRGGLGRDWESCLEGEIHLDQGSLPSCDTPFLKVSHIITASLNPSSDLTIYPTSRDPSDPTPLTPGSPTSKKHKRTSSSTSGGSKSSFSSTGSAPCDPAPGLSATQVRIVTAYADEGPKPAPFTPRPARKKKDLTTVQEVQWAGMTGFLHR